MKTISIITPCYNCQDYVEKCIKAVIDTNYDLNHIQHILVDDGSTDNTRQICDKWAKQYKHIQVFSKPNGNWGSVINFVKNKKLATGDYIIVCDSDDWVLPKSFQLVNEKCQDADIVCGDYWKFNGKRRTERVLTGFYLFKTFFEKKRPTQYFNSACLPHCTYIKNSVFYSIPDLKDKFYYQDGIFFSEVQKNAKSIKHIQKAVSIYWNVRPSNSNSLLKNTKGFESLMYKLQYYEQNDMCNDFFFTLMFLKPLRQYLKQNNIKYSFKTKKIDVSYFPFYMRPFLRLVYVTTIKKFIKK